jgi:hypothetical protein
MTFDPRLLGANFRRKPKIADWPSVSPTGHPGVDHIVGQEVGIEL